MSGAPESWARRCGGCGRWLYGRPCPDCAAGPDHCRYCGAAVRSGEVCGSCSELAAIDAAYAGGDLAAIAGEAGARARELADELEQWQTPPATDPERNAL